MKKLNLKNFNKIINLLSIVIAFLLPLAIGFIVKPELDSHAGDKLSPAEVESETESFDEFLRSPSFSAKFNIDEDNYIFVFDSLAEVTKCYKLDENNHSTTPVSYLAGKIYSMTSDGSNVFALTKSDNSIRVIKLTLDEEKQIVVTTIDTTTIVLNSIISIYFNNNKMIFLSSNGNFAIGNYNSSNEAIEAPIETVSQTTTIYEPILDGTIKKVVSTDENIYIMQENVIHKLIKNGPTYNREEFLTTTTEFLDFDITNNTLVALEQNKIVKKALDSETSNYLYLMKKNSITNISVSGDYVYMSLPNEYKVLGKILDNTQAFTVIENRAITPSNLETSDVFIAKAINSTSLQILPYTYADSIDISENSYVIVISTDETFFNHYYVIYPDKDKNLFGYIKRSDLEVVEEVAQNKTAVTFASETFVYSYPTTFIDETNQIKKALDSGTKVIEVSTLGTYKTINGNTFSRVKLSDGTIGFVETKRLASTSASKTNEIKNNAKVKEDATLYANPDGKDAVLIISKGTRVRADEKIDRNNEYTKITYTFEEGGSIQGYVLTSTLLSDSLTTLQILGIVFIFLNLAIFVTIVIMRLKFKRKEKNM